MICNIHGFQSFLNIYVLDDKSEWIHRDELVSEFGIQVGREMTSINARVHNSRKVILSLCYLFNLLIYLSFFHIQTLIGYIC